MYPLYIDNWHLVFFFAILNIMTAAISSVYIHIPFCTQICYYCDFSKVYIQNQPVDDYITALLKEVNHYQIPAPETLYIGGGTPSALSSIQLETLLTGLSDTIDMGRLKEFTIEANPGDLTPDKIAVLADSPCNRISLGVQTFDTGMLKRIGRSHTESDIYRTIEALKAANFDNISIDLIYALPEQTLLEVEKNVAKALALDIPHMSLYSLILENHTIFMNRYKKGQLHLPGEDIELDMFTYIRESLEANGYEHYEISNFTRPGYESKHNLVYWDNNEYYGLGAGASGYIWGMRYRNHGPIQHYLKAIAEKGHARLREEHLSQKEQMEEQVFLGLRKKTGISLARFEKRFGVSFETVYGSVVAKLVANGLLQQEGDRLRMTKRGLYLGDSVAQEFML